MENITPDTRKHVNYSTYMKAPERQYSIAHWFKMRKMACGDATLEQRKAAKLLQTTKDDQAIEFLECMTHKSNWK